jgi:hypothetical protein
MEGDGFPAPIPAPVKRQAAKYRGLMAEATEAKTAEKNAKVRLHELMTEHGIDKVPMDDGTGRFFSLEEKEDVVIKKDDKPVDRSAENAVD